MAVYFISNRLHAFTLSSSAIKETTSAGSGTTQVFDAANVSSAIIFPQGSVGSTEFVAFSLASPVNELWLHLRYNPRSSTMYNNTSFVDFVNSSGVVVARLRCNGSLSLRLEYWNGSSFVATAGLDAISQALNTFDIHLLCGVSGVFEWWMNGSLLENISGLNAAVDDVKAIRIYGSASSSTQGLSEVACADYDLRGSVVTSNVPTGDGHYTDGSGTYQDVDDIPLNSSTGKVLPSVSDKATFTKASRTFPSGFQIDAVAVNGNSRASGGGVTNSRALLRISSTDYTSPDLTRTPSFTPDRQIWESSPATATLFTPLEFNGLEFGMEARP